MRILLYFPGLLLLVLLAGCSGNDKTLNKRLTLWRSDKIPYGTFYAYENLQHVFPHARVALNKRSPDRYRSFTVHESSEDDLQYSANKTSYIIIGQTVLPDEKELNAILSMVGQGRNVFISAFRIGENLLDTLRLKTGYSSGYYNFFDSLNVSVTDPVTNNVHSFTYPGDARDNYFSSIDSSITTVLGRDNNGRADFVRFTYEGGGSLYIHLAPLALSNFFLLHKDNKAYYDEVFSYLPAGTQYILWDDYFRYHSNGDGSSGGGFSALGWILKQRGFNVAFWCLLALLAIVYVFESKRRQRMIPVVQPLKNASLDFVKTIGRLYFQRRDNKNLAQKMTAHFMDYVRTRYNIRTAVADEDFEHRLAYKSGYDRAAIKDLLYHIRYIQDENAVPDEMLLTLNQKFENFYKHT